MRTALYTIHNHRHTAALPGSCVAPVLMTVVVIIAALLSPSALAQTAQLTGTDLIPRRVTLLSMDDQDVRYIDPNGAERSLPIDQVLRLEMVGAFRPIDPPTALAGAAWLTDGQVLAGRWGGVIDQETIRWITLGDAEVALSLDDLLAVSISGPARPSARPEDDDVLGLVSGEQLAGFIETLGEKSIDFVIGEADDPVPLPLDRVAWLAIANDPEPIDKPQAGSAWVTLADGSRLLLEQVQTSRAAITGKLSLDTDQPDLRIALSRVAMIQPAGGALTLLRLAELDYRVLDGGEVFGLSAMPELDNKGRLRLHAPVTLGFDLPQGASRLSLVATLDLGPDVPAERAKLAGMELVVWQGDVELARQPIDADQPQATLNLPVTGRPLRIELDPGVNGPVLDRLLIESAEVLVGAE